MILGMNVYDATCYQMTVQFLIFAFTQKSRLSEIYVKISRKPDQNIPEIIDRNLKND